MSASSRSIDSEPQGQASQNPNNDPPGGSDNTDQSSNIESSSVESSSKSADIYRFLKPGSSYNGKTAASNIELSAATVTVLVAIDNWSRWKLLEPDVEVACGQQPQEVPEEVLPGLSEMVLFEKGVRQSL